MNDRSSYSLAGIEQAVLNELAAQSGLSQAEIASMLSLNKSHFGQHAQDKLADLAKDHLQLLAEVLSHGLAVFDQNTTAFAKWLQTPHSELAGAQIGFFSEGPTPPPPRLEEMGSTKPFDLMAYAIERDRQSANEQPIDQKRAYPTPLSLLDTTSGIKLVDDIFVRIEAGVYS